MDNALPDGLSEHYLTPLTRQIAAACGMAVAMKICAEWGGLHLVVPKRPSPEHRLVEVLGPADALKFCQAFGNGTIWPAKEQAYRHAFRRVQMLRMRAEGYTLAEIARFFGLSERRVSGLLGERAALAQQLGLPGFD